MQFKDIFNKPSFNYSDPGTGTKYSFNSKRIINKDGSFNVTKVGLPGSLRNTYQVLIGMSWTKFFITIFCFLFLVNALFAAIYLLIGIETIGIHAQTNNLPDFLDAYYFSFQTFTTVGYGTLSPVGILTNNVATVESILGWLCFALVTGLLYGRFSKPSAMLMYSSKAIIAPYKDGLNSLQFRIANMRKSNLMEMEATVMLMFLERNEDGTSILKRDFVPLELERNSILFFPLNWTLVHPITEKSPLYKKTQKEILEIDAEILIMIKGFDDSFSSMVHSRHSYKCDEIAWGAKFESMYETQKNGEIELYFDKLHDFKQAELN